MTAIFMIAPDGLSCFFHIYKFIAVNRDRRAFLWKSFRQEIRLALGKMWLARANMTFQPVLEGCVGFIFHSLCVDDYLGNTPGGCWADQVERGLEVLSTAGAPRKVKTEKSFCAFFRNCMRGNREWKMKSWDLGYLGGRVYWFSMRNGWLTPQMIAPGWEQVQRDQSPELNPQGNSRWISHLWCSQFPLSYATEGDIPYWYSLLWRKRWRHAGSHINIKEARVTLSSLKRTARVRGLHSGYFDRQCASERGNSSSFDLNGVCRAAAAYQFGSGVRWRLRHIETMRNPSDEDPDLTRQRSGR